MAPEPPEVPAVADLNWSELGDAVWLAMAIGEAEPRSHPEFEPAGTAPDESGPADGPLDPPEEPAGPAIPPLDLTGDRLVAGFAKSAEIFRASGGRALAGPSRALPDSAGILRALRPLKQTRPSRHHDDLVLDEERTAENAAQDRLWLPTTKPALVRGFDLTVVVDSSPSMPLWQPTVNAFLTVLNQLGAFRSVQIRRLETDGWIADEFRGPVLRGATPGAPERRPAELLDPSGHRLLMVLTDGMGNAWRHDLVSPLLAQWGRSMPVSIVHLLPQRLWGRTGPQLHQARLTTPGPMRPNRRYGLELPDAWLTGEDPETAGAGAVPVPVVELDARWLGWWTGLVTRARPDPVQAVVLLARSEPQPEAWWEEEPEPKPSARERVRQFRGAASGVAFRLGTLLAAVPVSLPIVRFVQAELVPEAVTADLAEVFASGLLEAAATAEPEAGTVFDFPGEIRAELLAAGRRSETAEVVLATTRRFGDRYPVLRRIVNALDDPDNTPIPEAGTELADIVLERAIMQALSGPYTVRAERLNLIETERAAGAAPDGTAGDGEAATSGDAMVAHVRDEAADSLRRVKQLTTDAPAVWGAVPARNPEFIGRRDLLRAVSADLAEDGRAVVLGVGGLGKSQVATEFIYLHLDDYDLVWWVSAAQETQIRASLTELARQLDLPGAEETLTAVPAVIDALRRGEPYRRWLLVFDSAGSPESTRQFLPVDGPGGILVTTRDTVWREEVPHTIGIGLFARGESEELLRRRDPLLTADQAEQLASRLGDLPLALAQAAALRAETGMPVAEYLRLFDEKVTEIVSASAPTEYEVPIAAAWNVSFDELGIRNPAAHQLLQVCAFFAPEPISRRLFTGVRRVSIAPELDRAMRDPTLLDEALREINRWGLAKVDHRSDTLDLHLHWLVQLVLRNRISAEDRMQIQHSAHLLLANHDPGDPAAARLWPQYHAVLPHIEAADVIGCDDDWVRELVINLLKFLYYWGDHAGATRLAQEVVQAWTERFGEGDPLTLEASERLGYFLWVLGRYEEAEVINNRTLLLYQQKEAAGQRSVQTLNAQLSVAVVLKARGDFAGARQLNLATYNEAVSLLGVNDPKTLTAAHDLVVSLLLTGEYDEARRIGEDTYERCADLLGPDNAATIRTLNILAICRRESGDYALARVELQKVVERVRRLVREDNAGVVRREYHLAVAQRKDGLHASALALSRRALDRFRVRYGPRHPSTLPCALAHSIDLRYAGDLEGARALGRQAVELYRASLGGQHPHTLIAEIDLGVTLRRLGAAAEAKKRDERAFKDLRAILGADHPQTIAAAVDLVNNRAALGEGRATSERIFDQDTRTLARARRILGEDHPVTLAVHLNRALDLRRLGRHREANAQHQDVVARYRRVLRADHSATISAEESVRAECDIDPTPL
ncbi:FxSxx-COOH system tetratricopeptide repeat protein [Amycolatopsis sp. NPDC003731]